METLDSLKAAFEGLVLLEKSDFGTSDGVRGIKFVTERDEKSGGAQKRIRQLMFFFKSGSTVLVATCSRLAGDPGTVDQEFDSAMKTFRFARSSGETKPQAPNQESTQTTAWKNYSNAKAGISFNYPSRCDLYDQKEKLPEKLRSAWKDAHLVFCLDSKPPVISFNMSVVKEPIPSSTSFAEYIGAVYDQICKLQELRRLVFRGFTVGGREAAEMIAVDKDDLRMKMVSVQGYNGAFFMMAFFTPSKEFDSLDKEVFKPWVNGVKVFDPAQAQAQSESPLLKKAEQGDAPSQIDLGTSYESGKGMPKDFGEAVKWYRKAADQGHAQGQYKLGRMYYGGNGVERDYQKAFELYRKSAEQNYAPAQASLGYMYDKGLGVPKDDQEAVNWYRKSADQGQAIAQNNLGVMYQSGRGVERDYQKALELYRKAAARDHAAAQCNLGIMCKKGYGTPKDEKEAVSWFRKSADQGYAGGQYNLAWMYHQGVGVAENRQEALKWYQKAAAQGHEEAKKALSLMNVKSQPNKP